MTAAGRGPRPPSAILVVDTNIVLSVVLGRRARPVFADVVARRTVIISERAAEEIRHVLQDAPGLPADASALAEALLSGLSVVASAIYADRLADAESVLANAVASRNGSMSDAHLLACAWIFDADIWSHDRDFAGTGWPSWSNANLRHALGPDPAATLSPHSSA